MEPEKRKASYNLGLVCNHCKGVVLVPDPDKDLNGQIQKIQEASGMVHIPKDAFSSLGAMWYCRPCQQVISEALDV